MKNVAVFLGSNQGSDRRLAEATVALANQLVERDCRLIYGGSQVGLMTLLADTVLERGGEVIGVIPRLLVDSEIAHPSLTQLYPVESMAERKFLMNQLADAFVVLPGGTGTLEECFQLWNEIRLGVHNKPMALLNIDGFYDHLLSFLAHAQQQQFISAAQQELLLVADEPAALLDRLLSAKK